MTQTQKLTAWLIAVVVIVLFYLLKPIIAPFLIAAFLAYLGDPFVKQLMQFKIPRTLAAILVFVVIMAAILLLVLFLVPLLSRQVTLFFTRLPSILAWFQQIALPWVSQHFNINLSLDPQSLKTIAAQHLQQAGGMAATVWTTLSHSGLALLGWLAKLLLIPIVTFYLLRDWDEVVQGIRQLIPRRIEPQTILLVRECDGVLSAFLRGQLSVMLALAIIYSIGLAIVGLDIALLLGVVAGALAIVPYLGIIVGVVVACITALVQFHDWLHPLYVCIVFAVGHLAESMVLTPWLIGGRIGLHPVAVIFAILAGGHLFGFTGVLLALPVAAIVMVLVRHMKRHYVQSTFYS